MDNKTNEKASITVAAKALRVSAKTIQRWVKSGKIQSIREDNRIFIPVDEIRARLQEQRASVEDIDQDKKEDVQTSIGHSEDKNVDVIPITRTHYEGLLTRLGQLEANQQLLLEYRGNIEQKDKELAEAKATITKARSELQRLLEIKQDAERKAKVVLDQRAALEAREQEIAGLRVELERARCPWWKRLFRK